ncbi:MAG: hypothetical protein M3R00_03010 [Pseudomonadota bacterium]|nr:hypothetical protein [Pseudomonadota bacterium]
MKQKDIILKLIDGEVVKNPNISEEVKARHRNSSANERAAAAYQVLKDHYRLNAEELSMLHALTGIDPFVLSIREAASHSLDANYQHPQDVNPSSVARMAKREELLQQLIAEKASRDHYNSTRRFAFRRKPVAELHAQIDALSNYAENFEKDGMHVNNQTVLYDTYIQSLNAKIHAFEQANSVRAARNPIVRLFISRKDTAPLIAAREFVQYHRDARQDLVHASTRLGAEGKVSRETYLNFQNGSESSFMRLFNNLAGFAKSTAKKLFAAHSKKQAIAESKLSVINFDINAVATHLDANGGKVIVDATKKDGKNIGIVQMHSITQPKEGTYDDSTLNGLGFPQRLQSEVDQIKACLQILEELKKGPQAMAYQFNSFIENDKAVNLANAKVAILGEDNVNIKKIDDYIAILKTADLDPVVKAAVVELSALRLQYQSLLVQDALQANDTIFKVVYDRIDAVIEKIKVLKVNQVINMADLPDYFDIQNKSWLTQSLGEMEKQTIELMKISPSRAAKNYALLEPKPDYARDDFANELANMCDKYVQVHNTAALQAEAMTENDLENFERIGKLSEILKANRVVSRRDYFTFVYHGKDQNHDYKGNAHFFETMRKAQDNTRNYFASFKSSTSAQIKCIDNLVMHLEFSLERYEHNYIRADQNPNFVALIDRLKPNHGAQNDTPVKRCKDLISDLKSERAHLSALLQHGREIKQATKLVTGQASNRFKP